MPRLPEPCARRSASLSASCAAASWLLLCAWAGPLCAQAGPGAGNAGEARAHRSTAAPKLRERAAAQSAATLDALHRARRTRDPVARCLDDVLAQLNSTRRQIDERLRRLEQAQDAGKRGQAEHERLALRHLERRLERLGAGRTCHAGEGAVALDPGAVALDPGAVALDPGAVAPNQTTVEMSVLGPLPQGEPVEI